MTVTWDRSSCVVGFLRGLLLNCEREPRKLVVSKRVWVDLHYELSPLATVPLPVSSQEKALYFCGVQVEPNWALADATVEIHE